MGRVITASFYSTGIVLPGVSKKRSGDLTQRSVALTSPKPRALSLMPTILRKALVPAGLTVMLVSGCAAITEQPQPEPPLSSIPPPTMTGPAYPQPVTTPRPSFEFETAAIPPPTAVPAYKQPSRAEEEQRITAQRLAQWQRSGQGLSSITTTGAVTSGIQPAIVPVVTTATSAPYSLPSQPVLMPAVATTAAPTMMPAVATGAPMGYAQTDYYAGDIYAGAAIPTMPQSARPGECFALVRTPEQYRSATREFVMRPGYDSVQVTPARYQTEMQSYVAQEAYEKLEIVPATFKTVTERVEISPPTTRMLASEPVYETVTERIVETPARQVWKRGRGPVERVDSATGEIMCLVEEPAVYKTVTRKVLKQQPQVREVQVPGEYRSMTRRVIDQPAQVRRVVVPEQRATMQVQKLVSPASYQTVRVPDQMGSYTTREMVAPATLEWRPVLCETNMSNDTVVRVQRALQAAGFDPGPIDGKAGRRTMDALNAYQRSKGLPEDRYLNLQTLQSLGVAA